MINYIQTKQNWLYARPRKLDSSYLSNGRLNPAVIRYNIEPAAGHLYLQYLLLDKLSLKNTLTTTNYFKLHI